jgi:hypothetical protein
MAVLGGLSVAAGAMSSGLAAGEITTALKVHKEAFQQDKRFFYAGYTESVAHHGEAYAQAERQHAQSYAQGEAAYYQSDRHHRRSFEQAKLQHRIDRDISMRAEIRAGLRDEFGQKNNRYNALMICQTVMLTCAFQLGLIELPWDEAEVRTEKVWDTFSWMYSAALGSALGMLSLSLWTNFIVTRRLNQYTAGVMQVEMHLNKAWRAKRGVDDVLDAALLRDYFRRWFQQHCALLADISMYGFSAGVITLFFAASILIHMRFELRNLVHNAGSAFFFILCAVSLAIVSIEFHERSLTKKKEGVYARPWVNKLTSSLKDQFNQLKAFEEQPLESQGLATGMEAPTSRTMDEAQTMMRAGSEETRARRHCPEALSVARTSSLSAKAAKTEQLLEKAWKMFQENEQREKDTKAEDWERDDWMSDILTEVQLLSRARHAARHHFDRVEHSIQREVNGEEEDEEDDSFDEILFDEEEAEDLAAVSQRDTSGRAGAAYRGDDASSRAPSSRVSRTPSQVSSVDEIDATQLRKKLGQYFRSTMVHITNATDVSLHLKTRRIGSGSWFAGYSPPTTIAPHTEVIFASTSKAKWVGGTEAEVAYDTRGEGRGPPSEFRLRWVNGIIAGERGRYCEAEVDKITAKSRGPASIGLSPDSDENPGDTYFVAKDDDDQEENSEVYFTITSQKAAEDHASQFGEGSYIQPRKGSSISAQETVMSGFLNKRRPDGLGFFWQLRYFMLTRSRLGYFRAQADTRAHAQLGQLAMKDVIAVQLDEGSTEFVVVIANSQRAPYTLKAESPADARRWADAIEMHAPRIAMMKGGNGGSTGGGSVASAGSGGESMAGRSRDYEVGALRDIAEGDGGDDGNGEGSAGTAATRDGEDDSDSLILPPRRARPAQSNTNGIGAGAAADDDVPPDPDTENYDRAGGHSGGEQEEEQEEDEALWDGLPQSRRRRQQQDESDQASSVSTRLMFASVRLHSSSPPIWSRACVLAVATGMCRFRHGPQL